MMQKYQQLVADGTFSQVLLDMYRWGKQHGWDGAHVPADAQAAQ